MLNTTFEPELPVKLVFIYSWRGSYKKKKERENNTVEYK